MSSALALQTRLDAVRDCGGRIGIPRGRYAWERTVVIDTSSLCLCGDVWSYSRDPNGVFASKYGTQLRCTDGAGAILQIGATRTLGGVVVRDLGFAGNIAGMDTRALFDEAQPARGAGLLLAHVRTDQCEFSKLSFCGLSSAVCATGDAEIDACIFEKLNTDGCANGVYFAPHAAYYTCFRFCIAADNPYYGFYADGRGRHIHNLKLWRTDFVRCGGAFSPDAPYAAAILYRGISRSEIDGCLIDDAGTYWHYDDDATENRERQPSHRRTVGIWVIGNENRITNNTFRHSSDDAIRVQGDGNVLMNNIADGHVRINGTGNTVVNTVFTRPEARLILEGEAAATTTVIGVEQSRIVLA